MHKRQILINFMILFIIAISYYTSKVHMAEKLCSDKSHKGILQKNSGSITHSHYKLIHFHNIYLIRIP